MLVQFIQIFWQNIYKYIFKVSFQKNWTTLNFLKVLYYISIWIVILIIIIDLKYSKSFFNNLLNLEIWESECHGYIEDTIYDWSFYWPYDAASYMFLSNFEDWRSLLIYDGDDMGIITPYGYNSLAEYSKSHENFFLIKNYNIFYYYYLWFIIFDLLMLLINIWYILLILFIFIHIYFSINNIFKDYLRDINITLQLFYLFVSIFSLLNILYYVYNSWNIITLSLCVNILKINILYIFIYLFLIFILNKNKNIFINSLKYLIISVISSFIFIILIWNINIWFFSGWANISLNLYQFAYDIGYEIISNLYYLFLQNLLLDITYMLYNFFLL
jgi:hypothetical protein